MFLKGCPYHKAPQSSAVKVSLYFDDFFLKSSKYPLTFSYYEDLFLALCRAAVSMSNCDNHLLHKHHHSLESFSFEYIRASLTHISYDRAFSFLYCLWYIIERCIFGEPQTTNMLSNFYCLTLSTLLAGNYLSFFFVLVSNEINIYAMDMKTYC